MNILLSSRDVSLTTTPTVVVFDGFYMTTMIHLPLLLKKEQVVGTLVLSGCCSGVAFSTVSNMTHSRLLLSMLRQPRGFRRRRMPSSLALNPFFSYSLPKCTSKAYLPQFFAVCADAAIFLRSKKC